jgi:hypothetical protein
VVEEKHEDAAQSGAAKEKTAASALKLKDWAALSISFLALAISGGNAYFSTLRLEDHLSVIFTNAPLAFWNDDDHLVVPPENLEATAIFINSGNRGAIVISLDLFFVQYSQAKPDYCANYVYGNGATFSTDFTPLVVREKEVTSKKVKIASFHGGQNVQKDKEGAYYFPIDGAKVDKNVVQVSVCAAIRVATPSIALHDTSVFAFTYSAVKGRGLYSGDTTAADPLDKLWRTPQELIKETRTIFSE